MQYGAASPGAELLDLTCRQDGARFPAQAPDMVSNFSGIIRSSWREEKMTFKIVFTGLVVIAAASLQAGAQTEINVTAKKYEFDPSTIKVKQGNHVRLVITALDHDHGFKLEAFNIDQLLKKGEAVPIEFSADKAGTFPFECSHFCGLGHKRMKGGW